MATSLNLETNFLKGDGEDDTTIDFTKEITINFEDLETIQGRDINQLDETYVNENNACCGNESESRIFFICVYSKTVGFSAS